MPMWQCSFDFLRLKRRAQTLHVRGQSTEGFSGESPLPLNLSNQIIASKTIFINVYLWREKDKLVFFFFFFDKLKPIHNLHKSALKCH